MRKLGLALVFSLLAPLAASAAPPVARFHFTCSLLSCLFDGSTSSAGVVSYSWDFPGSGGTGAVVPHSYPATGCRVATLTVTDIDGLQDSRSKQVCVTDEAPVPAERFFPLPPCRIVDTRTNIILTSGQIRVFSAAGNCGIPLTAKAVSLNATVVSPTGNGNLVFYAGNHTSEPFLHSTLNFNPPASPRINNAILRLATDGTGTLAVLPTVFGAPNQVHLILDIDGYFSDDPGGLGYQDLTLCRAHLMVPVTSGFIQPFGIAGLCGVPVGSPVAALNLTVLPPFGGSASFYQPGTPLPMATLRFMNGTLAMANGVRAQLGGAGGTDIAGQYDPVVAPNTSNVTIDAYGYFSSSAPLVYRPITPCRSVDTRSAAQGGPDPLAPGLARDFQIQGNCGVPVGAKAAMVNITSVMPITGPGHLIPYASGTPALSGSILNFHPVQGNLANGTIVSLSTLPDDLSLLANINSTHVLVDVFGYFQ